MVLGTTPGRLEAVFDIVTAQALSLAAAEAHFDAAVNNARRLSGCLERCNAYPAVQRNGLA